MDLLPSYGQCQSLGTDSTNEYGDMGGTHGSYTNYNELYIYIYTHKHLHRYLWVLNDAGYVAIWLTWRCHMWVLPKSGDECKEHGAILVFPTGYMHAYSQQYWMDLIQTWSTIQFIALFSLTITSMINQRFGVPYFQTHQCGFHMGFASI